jgi:hypothetical protein
VNDSDSLGIQRLSQCVSEFEKVNGMGIKVVLIETCLKLILREIPV